LSAESWRSNLGRGADPLFHDQRDGDTATVGRVGRILDCHVVIRHHVRDLTPGHLGRRACC
jgi:hypothetical protein